MPLDFKEEVLAYYPEAQCVVESESEDNNDSSWTIYADDSDDAEEIGYSDVSEDKAWEDAWQSEIVEDFPLEEDDEDEHPEFDLEDD